MKYTLALICGFAVTAVAIQLYVSGHIGKTVLAILLTFAIASGLVIAKHDKITGFKGGGIDMQMAQQKVDGIVDAGIDKIKGEIAKHEDSITLLTRSANQINEKLEKTIEQVTNHEQSITSLIETARESTENLLRAVEMAAPPTLSLLQEKVKITKTDSGYTALLKFKPSKNKPLGQIVLIATVIGELGGKIVDFWPRVGPAFLTGADSKKISEDGNKAQLIFQLIGIGNPEVELKMSEASKVLISGSHDLKALIIDIK